MFLLDWFYNFINTRIPRKGTMYKHRVMYTFFHARNPVGILLCPGLTCTPSNVTTKNVTPVSVMQQFR